MKMNACEEYNMYIYKITTMTKVSFTTIVSKITNIFSKITNMLIKK